jgi:hypothetical protein
MIKVKILKKRLKDEAIANRAEASVYALGAIMFKYEINTPKELNRIIKNKDLSEAIFNGEVPVTIKEVLSITASIILHYLPAYSE